SRSKSTGPPVRLAANCHFLLHAVRLGLGDFHIVKPSVPVVARDRSRIYVFVPLSEESAIPPFADAVRIDSAGPIAEPSQQPSPPRRMNIMPSPQPNGHTNGTHDVPARGERPVALMDLIAEAEELRTALADASTRLGRLLSGLKQHRRDS